MVKKMTTLYTSVGPIWIMSPASSASGGDTAATPCPSSVLAASPFWVLDSLDSVMIYLRSRVAGAAQVGPVNVGAQLFACHLAIRGFFNFRAPFRRNGALAACPKRNVRLARSKQARQARSHSSLLVDVSSQVHFALALWSISRKFSETQNIKQ